MTTAGRPTFDPARGGSGRGEKSLSALSKQYSARDLPGHTKLKYRQPGQNAAEDLKERDFRRELQDRERPGSSKDSQSSRPSSTFSDNKRLRIEPEFAEDPPDKQEDDEESDEEDDDEEAQKSSEEEEDDDSDEDDSEEDTEALLAELEKIKKERAAEAAKKDAEKKAQEETIRMENILSGNPLIGASTSTGKTDFKVKRRWDDDVVFKNCAKGEPDKSKPKFINDTLRSEFHKNFMDRYIK